MVINEIITDVSNEAYINIIESYIDILNKCEYIQESYVQEGKLEERFRPVNENGVKEKMIFSILWAIPRFFKMIGESIIKFFKKTKDTVMDKLKKLFKKDQGECDKIQDAIDSNVNGVDDKMLKLAEEEANKNGNIDSELVEDNKEESDDGKKKKKKKKDKTTKMYLKGKKTVCTRINFDNWSRFVHDMDNYLNELIEYKKTRKKLPKVTDNHLIGDKPKAENPFIFTRIKYRMKKIKLFKTFPRWIPLGDYIERSENIMSSLELIRKRHEDISEMFKDIEDALKADPDARAKSLKAITETNNELITIYNNTNIMLNYLSGELALLGSFTDMVNKINVLKGEKENDYQKRINKIKNKLDSESADEVENKVEKELWDKYPKEKGETQEEWEKRVKEPGYELLIKYGEEKLEELKKKAIEDEEFEREKERNTIRREITHKNVTVNESYDEDIESDSNWYDRY